MSKIIQNIALTTYKKLNKYYSNDGVEIDLKDNKYENRIEIYISTLKNDYYIVFKYPKTDDDTVNNQKIYNLAILKNGAFGNIGYINYDNPKFFSILTNNISI